jgi:hypothetical protein
MPDNVGGGQQEIKYSEAIEVALRPSRQASGCLALAGASTLAILALTPWPSALLAALGAGVLAAALEAHVRIALRRGHRAVRGFRLDRAGAIEVTHPDGRHCAGRLQAGSLVAPWLTIVRWRPEGARFDRTIVVLPDMLDGAAFRHLRVLLRWGSPFPGP